MHMYTDFLIRWRKRILIFWMICLLACLGVLASKLLASERPVIDNSVGIWFDSEDPELIRYRDYNDTFGEKEWTLLLLQTKSIYDPEFLRDLETVSRRLQELDHVVKITSITNVRDNFSSADGMLDYRRLFSHALLEGGAPLVEYRKQLERNPIFERNLLVKDDDRYTVVLIQNDNFIHEQSPYRIELIDSIEAILGQYPTIESYALAGTTVVNAELNRAAARDVVVFYGLVAILLTAVAIFMLRSLRDLLVMYAVVVTGTLPAMSLLAAFGIAYNMVTVMLPTILSALSVAGVVHIITEFHRERGVRGTADAMQTSLRLLYKPTLWTTLTTIAGFCAFTTSDVFPVFQLGAFAVLGLALACVANLVIAPTLLIALWPDAARPSSGALRTDFVNALQSKRGYLRGVLALGVVVVLPMFGLARLEVDTNYIDFFSDSHPTTQAYERIKQAGFGQNPVIVHVRYPANDPYASTKAMVGTLEFEDAVATQPEVIKLLSPTMFLGEINRAFNEDEALPLGRYNKSQREQLLLLAELSGNDDLSDLLARGGSDAQLVVMTDYMSSRELRSFREKLLHLGGRYLPPGTTVRFTGTTTLWANMDTEVSRTQLLSLLAIGIFLALFLPLIFESVRLGIVGLIINVTPLAATLGLMSYLGIKINIATALIGGIALGIVVDDTIHLVNRIVQNRRRGDSTAKAVDEAARTIGKSIVRTSFILIVGFSCMATSQFLPTAHFGIFISLSIALALILDLVFLPALLKAFPQLIPHYGESPPNRTGGATLLATGGKEPSHLVP